LYRLRTAWNFESQPGDEQLAGKSYEVRLDHLSARDLAYLQHSVSSSLPWNSESFTPILHRYLSLVRDNAHWKALEQLKAQVVLGSAPLAIQGESQPLHPLVNEPLALISGSNAPLPSLTLLARLQECKLDLYYLKQGLQRADESGKLLKPSEMTRLERSLASRRIPALMKDATQPVGFFLSDCGQMLYDFIQQLDHQVFQVPAVASAIRAVVDFCADIFKVSGVKHVDEGEFQIYLQIGRELCGALFNSSPFFQPLAVALSQHLSRFQAEWALTTGLSMQKIWDAWRPATPATRSQLELVMQLEAVAHEFGNLATKTRLELSQLSRVRNSLIDAQRAILIDGADGELLVEVRLVDI